VYNSSLYKANGYQTTKEGNDTNTVMYPVLGWSNNNGVQKVKNVFTWPRFGRSNFQFLSCVSVSMRSMPLVHYFCLTVRRSHCHVQFMWIKAHTIQSFGRGINVVFWPYCCRKIATGSPSAKVLNTRGWENFAIFNRNHRLSRKRYAHGYYGLIIH